MGESLECITVAAPALPVDYVVTGVFDNDVVTVVVVERRLLRDIVPAMVVAIVIVPCLSGSASSSSTVAPSSSAATVCVSSYTVSRSTVTVNSNSCVVEPVFVSCTPASRALAGLSAEQPERAKSVAAVRTLRLEASHGIVQPSCKSLLSAQLSRPGRLRHPSAPRWTRPSFPTARTPSSRSGRSLRRKTGRALRRQSELSAG